MVFGEILTAAFSEEVNNMGYPTISGGTNEKGGTVTKESYDRGSYTETITRVEKDDKVDIYVDKESK